MSEVTVAAASRRGVVGLGGLEGLQRDRVGGERAGPQRRGDSDGDVLVIHRRAKQEHVDQGAGALAVAPGHAQALRTQGLQVVVQLQLPATFGSYALEPGDFLAFVIDDQLRGVQHDLASRPISRTGTE
ncbi:hypothetical protein [Actinomadura chokoriensis]|uniref:Uncharacterized protein n=1 Tax=Actinomadura chokoriensis TaxID=454156 RepID=A0ABV4R4B6_9ACTN